MIKKVGTRDFCASVLAKKIMSPFSLSLRMRFLFKFSSSEDWLGESRKPSLAGQLDPCCQCGVKCVCRMVRVCIRVRTKTMCGAGAALHDVRVCVCWSCPQHHMLCWDQQQLTPTPTMKSNTTLHTQTMTTHKAHTKTINNVNPPYPETHQNTPHTHHHRHSIPHHTHRTQ